VNEKNPKKQKHHVSYIDTLEFSERDSRSLIGRYFSNVRLMLVLFLSIAIGGVISLITLPKTLNPEIDIPFFVITTVLPGGSSADVEQLVTQPLERELKRITGIDRYSSVAQDSISITTIEFSPQTEQTQARADLDTALDAAQLDFPEDALEPRLTQIDFENVPVWTFALLVKGSDVNQSVSLTTIARDIQDATDQSMSIQSIEASGLESRQIMVIISPEKVAQLGLNPAQVSNRIKETLTAYPSGSVTSRGYGYAVSIEQPVTSVAQLRRLLIDVNDRLIPLADVAEIYENASPDATSSLYADANTSPTSIVVFSAYKTKSARIDTAKKEMEQVVGDVLQNYPDTVTIQSIMDYDAEINTQIFDLIDNFWQTLALIFLSMLALYGIRQSIIASLAIPAALLIVFIVMRSQGFTLNFLSIYSLLVALGLFTDNAVVVIEGYTSIYRSGKFTPFQTAVLTFKEFALEIFTINILTCWAFLPLLTLSGIIGEFIKPMPIIVSTAMMASVIAALLFTLPMLMLLLSSHVPKRVRALLGGIFVFAVIGLVISITPKNWMLLPIVFLTLVILACLYLLKDSYRASLNAMWKRHVSIRSVTTKARRYFDHGFIRLDTLIARYRRIITKILASKRYRRQIMASTLLVTLFGYVLIPLGLVKNEFFPKSDAQRIYVEYRLPAGSSTQVSLEKGTIILERLRTLPYSEYVSMQLTARNAQGFDLTQAGTNDVLFTIHLVDATSRPSSLELGGEIRDLLSDIADGSINVIESSEGGPPAGADVEIAFRGENLDTLLQLAEASKRELTNNPNVGDVTVSVRQETPKVLFKPDQTKLTQFDLDESDIGFWMRSYLSGFDVKESNFASQDYPIVVRLDSDQVQAADITKLEIPRNEQSPVPLSLLGDFSLQANPNAIYHQDGIRSVSVTASALPGTNPVEINSELESFVTNNLQLPDGYAYVVGGSNEANNEANQGIFVAMGVSAVLILATMVITLGSFRKAFIVMLVIPIAVSGVLALFALTATPISMPAMIGLLSLFGIVIANSLMIVDKVTKNVAVGFAFEEALAEAASSRLEPILLTSAAQIIGLIPATLGDPIWRGFGGAIIAGLSFSGFVMLLFVPVVYYYLFPHLHTRKFRAR
jgi:HAE1 family hydrophobic/amphiphilic exporter-1